MRLTILLSVLLLCVGLTEAAFATPDTKQTTSSILPLNQQVGDEPIYVKSDSLSLQSKERVFVYTGNVEVTQGDMVLNSDAVEGKYTEKNKIQSLTAKKNVVITRGEELKARGEQALYDAVAGTVTLTENPEVEQNGSILTADKITIFLADNRSVAEGDVRVKLIKAAEDAVEGPAKQKGQKKQK